MSDRHRPRLRLRTPTPFAVAIALTLACTAGDRARAEEPTGPIVLTNRDVDRLVKQSDASTEGGSGLILVPSTTPPAPPAAVGARAPRATDDEAGLDDADRARPESWQEEYYRLKTIALKRAIERGDPIDFADEIPDRDADADRSAPAAPFERSSACLYDRHGALLHAPSGLSCRPNRMLERRGQQDPGPGSDEACVYGRKGEVVYAPPGRRCERGGRGSWPATP